MAEPNIALVIRPVLDPPSSTCAMPRAASLVGGAAGVLKRAGCGGDLVPGPRGAALPDVLGPAWALGWEGAAAAAAAAGVVADAAAGGKDVADAAGAELAAAVASCKACTARVCMDVSCSSCALSASSLWRSSLPLQQKTSHKCKTAAV